MGQITQIINNITKYIEDSINKISYWIICITGLKPYNREIEDDREYDNRIG